MSACTPLPPLAADTERETDGGVRGSAESRSSDGLGGAGDAGGGDDTAESRGSNGAGGGGGTAESRDSVGSGGTGGAGGSAGNGIDEDPHYAAIEKVSDHIFTRVNDLRGLAFSSTGKIWASGHSDADATNRKLVLARFNADGTPDTSFDADGFRVHDLGPGDEQSIGVVELASGDVIVQANVSDGQGGAAIPDAAPTPGTDGVRGNGTNVVLLRFTSSGQLVTTFGTNGVAPVLFGWAPADDESWPVPTYNSMATMANQRYSHSGFPTDQAWGVELDSSGSEEKLVVNGFGPAKKVSNGPQRTDYDRYVARLLASTGAPDPMFNGGSAYTFSTAGTLPDGGRRAIVERDGAIISSGFTNLGSGKGNHVVLLRLKPNGTPDTDFGFGPLSVPGVAVLNPFIDDGGEAECYAIARQPNDRYITTGYGRATAAGRNSRYGYATTDGVDLVSFAVKADGTGMDTTWGVEGTRAIQSEEASLGGTEDRGRDLVVLPDGRVIQVGRYGTRPAIFVVTPSGELDDDSGDHGVFTYTSFATMPSHFFAAARSADGKRIAATTSHHAEGVILAVLEVAD